MLLIKTYIDKSNIHGIGLFSDQDVNIGDIIWKYSDLDMILNKKMIEKLPNNAKEYIKKHAYFDKQLNKHILSFDDDRYTNHSLDPNTKYYEEYIVAIKTIKKGDEITINYYEIDEFANEKLNK